MKTCDEMVNSLLKRREQYLLEQKQKRRTAAKIAVFGGSCTLAAVIGIGIWNNGMPREKGTVISDNSYAISNNPFPVNSEPVENLVPPVLDRSSVIWAESGVEDNVGIIVIAEEGALKEFGGKTVTKTLFEAFKEHGDDSVFAVAVFYFSFGQEEKDFIYNGKTLAEYDEDALEKCLRSMDLSYIRNNAECLKYGREYYITNTVKIDGIPWTKYDYDHAVELVGEEFISKYFVDGEFLEDEFTSVYDKAREEYQNSEDAYRQAYSAWKTSRLEKETERLTSLGINCELRNSPDSFVMFVTKDEFAALAFDNSGNWFFGLAQENERDVIGNFIDE